MAHLELRDAAGTLIGTVSVRNGRARSTGAAGRSAARLTVVEPGNPRHRLTPVDGDAWIRALVYEFRTPYVEPLVVEDPATLNLPRRAPAAGMP